MRDQLSCCTHWKKREDMRDQKTNAQKNAWDNINPLSPPPPPTDTLLWINHPHLSHPTIIHNNNTMDTEFLRGMGQSNKCGSVMNDEIFNFHLGSGMDPWVSITCLLQDTSHIYWFHPPTQLTRRSKEPRNGIPLLKNNIFLPSSTYTETRSKRGRVGIQPYDM